MPFSIRRYLYLVDQNLLNQCPPHEFTRAPRSIASHLSYWKASEFKVWLLFYSLPLLLDILPALYFHHYALLVCSMHLLLQKQLSVVQCDAAEEMLNDFCNIFPELYGDISCTINMHSLIHIPYFVRLWGPLWCQSAFSFESHNGNLISMVHSKRRVAEQLSFSLNVRQALQKISGYLEKHESQDLLKYLDYNHHSRSNMTNGYAIGSIKSCNLSVILITIYCLVFHHQHLDV